MPPKKNILGFADIIATRIHIIYTVICYSFGEREMIFMKKAAFALGVLFLVMNTAAYAEVKAEDAMMAYVGSEAFTKLTPEERQACVEWLVNGGTMKEECRNASMKLVTEAPDVVTAEQRQALILAASGKSETAKAPVEDNTPTVKKDDNTGKIIAAGLVGLLAGLVIHNNVRHHKAAPTYHAAPPAPGRNFAPNAPNAPGRRMPPPPSARPVPPRR